MLTRPPAAPKQVQSEYNVPRELQGWNLSTAAGQKRTGTLPLMAGDDAGAGDDCVVSRSNKGGVLAIYYRGLKSRSAASPGRAFSATAYAAAVAAQLLTPRI